LLYHSFETKLTRERKGKQEEIILLEHVFLMHIDYLATIYVKPVMSLY